MHKWYLSFYMIPPTVCIPSMKLPSLDHAAHHSQQWVTPELGLNSTRVKGFLTRLMALEPQERLCHGCSLNYQPTVPHSPHACPTPRSVPLLYSTTPWLPHFLFELQQHAGKEFEKPCSYNLSPSEKNSQQFSHLERFLMGLTNRLFNIPQAWQPASSVHLPS